MTTLGRTSSPCQKTNEVAPLDETISYRDMKHRFGIIATALMPSEGVQTVDLILGGTTPLSEMTNGIAAQK